MSASSKSERSNLAEMARSALIVVAIFVGIRAFLMQPFNIPSGSMKATLLIGDHVAVTKFSYGYSRYSLPFAPIPFSGRIFASLPERGDIVVFRAVVDGEERDLIKRIVGLPGETIQVTGGQVQINGQPVKREQIANFVGEDACAGDITTRIAQVKRWRETLPNGVVHETLDCSERGELDNTPVFTVPAGQYFMMGDNRDASLDSRVQPPEGFGFVPFENIIGRAQIVYFSVHEGEQAWMVWRWPWSVRWSRLFTVLR